MSLSSAIPTSLLKSYVKIWLEEDISSFDFGGLVVGNKLESATLFVKSPGTLAGVPFFNAVFAELGCKVEWFEKEGKFLNPVDGKIAIAIVKGPCRNILLGERVALNCLSRASGVASACRRMIAIADGCGWGGRISGTRKTTPGFRLVEKYALMVAKADTHRYDLSSMVMLKDNHICSSGSICNAVRTVKKAAGFTIKTEVECQSLEEGLEAAQAGADIIMFDNFSGEELTNAAKSLKHQFPHVLVEASGGITAENLHQYCSNYVNIISSSKLVQGYACVDFSLKVLHCEL